MSSTRIVVPTSERKHKGGTRMIDFREAQDERDSNRFPSLKQDRRIAIDALRTSMNGAGTGPEVLGLHGEALEEAVRDNLDFDRGAVLPAIEREAGPLFGRLSASSLPPRVQRRLRRELVMVCPLLGLLSPQDLVPRYRVPAGAQIPELGSLHDFWKAKVSARLNRLCAGKRVFSFLRGRLRALWVPNRSVGEVVHLGFARRRNGRLRFESAGAGGLGGTLMRHMLLEGIEELEPLLAYRSPQGHAWSEVHSCLRGREKLIVFVL